MIILILILILIYVTYKINTRKYLPPVIVNDVICVNRQNITIDEQSNIAKTLFICDDIKTYGDSYEMILQQPQSEPKKITLPHYQVKVLDSDYVELTIPLKWIELKEDNIEIIIPSGN